MNSIKLRNLDLIESHFNESSMLSGEQLLDANEYIVDYDRGDVLCRVSGNGYKADISKKIFDRLDYKCTCTPFETDAECQHVFLCLILYRKYLIDRKTKAKQLKVRRSKNQKSIDIGLILENLNTEELHNFLRSYASKDRKFSIAIKTKFAHKVELPNNSLKYKQILDSILSPISKKDEKVRQSDLKQLCKVIIELSHQSMDLISINQLVEAADILMVLTNKWEYSKNKHVSDQQAFINVQKEIFNTWHELSTKTIPPDLRKKIYEYFLDLLGKSYFMPYHPEHNTGEVALLFFESRKRLEGFNELIDAKYIKAKDEKEQAWFLTLKLRLDQNNTQKYLKELSEKPNLIPVVLQRLISLKAYSTSLLLLEELIKVEPNSLKLHEKYLDVAIGLNSWDKAIELTIWLCKKTQRLTYYKKTRTALDDSHKALLYKSLTDKLNDPSGREDYLKMSILHLEDEWRGILEFAIETHDFILMERYMAFLNEKSEDEYALTYIQMLDYYFEHHIGDKADVFLAETLDLLRRSRCNYVADLIVNFVKSKYPVRLELK